MQLSVSVSWTVIILKELKFKKQLISDAWMQPKKIRVAAMEYKLWHKIREEKEVKSVKFVIQRMSENLGWKNSGR